MIYMREKESQPEGLPAPEKVLTCEEFQARMPELIGSENIRDQEHLKTCDRCSALLEELEYIAEMASQLMPSAYDPPDQLWNKIESSLQQESVDSDLSGNGHSTLPIGKK